MRDEIERWVSRALIFRILRVAAPVLSLYRDTARIESLSDEFVSWFSVLPPEAKRFLAPALLAASNLWQVHASQAWSLASGLEAADLDWIGESLEGLGAGVFDINNYAYLSLLAQQRLNGLSFEEGIETVSQQALRGAKSLAMVLLLSMPQDRRSELPQRIVFCVAASRAPSLYHDAYGDAWIHRGQLLFRARLLNHVNWHLLRLAELPFWSDEREESRRSIQEHSADGFLAIASFLRLVTRLYAAGIAVQEDPSAVMIGNAVACDIAGAHGTSDGHLLAIERAIEWAGEQGIVGSLYIWPGMAYDLTRIALEQRHEGLEALVANLHLPRMLPTSQLASLNELSESSDAAGNLAVMVRDELYLRSSVLNQIEGLQEQLKAICAEHNIGDILPSNPQLLEKLAEQARLVSAKVAQQFKEGLG